MKHEWWPPAAKDREHRLFFQQIMCHLVLCVHLSENLLLQISSRDLNRLHLMLATLLISEGVGLNDLQRSLPTNISLAI